MSAVSSGSRPPGGIFCFVFMFLVRLCERLRSFETVPVPEFSLASGTLIGYVSPFFSSIDEQIRRWGGVEMFSWEIWILSPRFLDAQFSTSVRVSRLAWGLNLSCSSCWERGK